MGVEQRPKDNKMVKKLDKYTELISKEQFDENTSALRKELYDHFGTNSVQLLELDLIFQHAKGEKKLKDILKTNDPALLTQYAVIYPELNGRLIDRKLAI
jgi:hypothetical protein